MGGGGKGGKKGGGEPYYVEYRMTAHLGICHGPVDALLGIYVKERDAWPGTTVYDEDEEAEEQETNLNISSFKDLISLLTNGGIQPTKTTSVATEPGPLAVSRRDLFGGNEKEGGVEGEAYWLPGREDQVIPEHIAGRYGLTTATMVGYRGLASVFFSKGGDKGGFLWGANNPYMNTIWFTVFRASVGLNPLKQTIQIGDLPPDTNAANIIYESLTNDDWGMGAPDTILDMNSFVAAQSLFFDEKFGLSLAWVQQTTVEAFITEILDHVQATLFVNPMTGLLTIKPIRGDYVVADLPRFGPHNCDLSSRSRKAWGETINEVNISWTNPVNEESETITFQDLANIVMQNGEVVSDTRDYYGIRNKELASMVGARDIRSASQPLFATEMETDRTGWNLTPGACLVLDWPEDGLSDMVMRITNVDYGRPGSMSVKVSLMEDIFSLSTATWTSPPVTEWIDPTTEPQPADYMEIVTAPYAILTRAGLAVDDDLYPRVVPAILASSDEYDTTGFQVVGNRVLPNGSTEVNTPLTSFAPTSRGELAVAMPQQATTTMTQAQLGSVMGREPEIASFALLGAGGDADMELVMFDSFNATTGVWTIARGILDTVPKAWPVGTPIWYLDNYAADTSERHANTTVSYKLQTRSSGGELPLALAPTVSKLLSARPYLPSRPANVQIGGVGVGGGRKIYTARPTTVPVTWANRNRLTEDTVVRRWTEGNVTPEEGQTTRIEVTNEAGLALATYNDLTGTSFNVPWADFEGWRYPRIRVSSVRDGFASLQAVEIEIEMRLFGYGNNYGFDYGENNG